MSTAAAAAAESSRFSPLPGAPGLRRGAVGGSGGFGGGGGGGENGDEWNERIALDEGTASASDGGRGPRGRRKVGVRDRVGCFRWSWFTLTMVSL